MTSPERGPGPEAAKSHPNQERGHETPEIFVEPDRSLQLLSMMLRGYDRTWGEPRGGLTADVDTYFARNPLEPATKALLDRIGALTDAGTDEETLRHLAASLARPNRTSQLLGFVEQHKRTPVEPHALRDELAQHLARLEEQLPTDLLKKIRTHEQRERGRYEAILPELQRQVARAIEFFRPSAALRVSEVQVLPWDGLFRAHSGSSIDVGDAVLVRGPADPAALTHEFMHQFINPIARSTVEHLGTHARGVTRAASLRLRQDEEYGEDPEVLLAEELIRTYTDIIAPERTPENAVSFARRVDKLSDTTFSSISRQEPIRSRLAELRITSRGDFRQRATEYFQRFEQNELRNQLFDLYGDYRKASDADQKLRFEDYAPTALAKHLR